MVLVGFKIKIVALFSTTKGFNAVRNFFNGNAVENTLTTRMTEFMDGEDLVPVTPRFSPGWTLDIFPVKLVEDFGGVNNDWEAYKPLSFLGDMLIPESQFETEFSNMLEQIKIDYGLAFGGQGYNPPSTDPTIMFHVHYIDNRAPAGDEF
jgi:hypothetical protein